MEITPIRGKPVAADRSTLSIAAVDIIMADVVTDVAVDKCRSILSTDNSGKLSVGESFRKPTR